MNSPKWSSNVKKSGGVTGEAKPAPKKQPDFRIGNVDFLKVGTIAIFGVEDLEVIENIASKLNRASSMCGQLVMSRMGEEVPEPDNLDVEPGNEWPMKLEYREKMVMDKVFCILYMQGYDDNQGRNFAYVNVRGDRLENLREKMLAGPTFNLPDYSTIVLTGEGMPTFEHREKLQRDYLFGERHTNVRIFPPLSEVT
ncbi:hypothetical protein GC177_02750 [bacterium]|nr:hypothetical protein [bacterium]